MRFWFLCLSCAIGVSLSAADVDSNRKLLLGSWYCSSADVYHRFGFNADGTFTWSSYIAAQNNQHRWSSNFTEPAKYNFRTASEVQAGMFKLVIQSLSATAVAFTWGGASYSCTRTPPSGDTAASRAAAISAQNKEKQAFLGRWVSADKAQYVEFLPDDACVMCITTGRTSCAVTAGCIHMKARTPLHSTTEWAVLP
jgi:hypothetical protein